MFPIQKDSYGPAGHIPWKLAEVAYQAYEAAGHRNQSLQTLADRGGFSWTEVLWLLRGPEHYRYGHDCQTSCWSHVV